MAFEVKVQLVYLIPQIMRNTPNPEYQLTPELEKMKITWCCCFCSCVEDSPCSGTAFGCAKVTLCAEQSPSTTTSRCYPSTNLKCHTIKKVVCFDTTKTYFCQFKLLFQFQKTFFFNYYRGIFYLNLLAAHLAMEVLWVELCLSHEYGLVTSELAPP